MICTVQEISKMLGGNTIFDNVSLHIKTGDKVGIVGRNGSGKTTLFKLIAGIESPDQGIISFKKGTQIGYLAQIPAYESTLSGRDVMMLAFSELHEMKRQIEDMESQMTTASPDQLERILSKYGVLQEQFSMRGGYEMDAELEKMIEGLQLHAFVERAFSTMSGGEQTKIMLGQLLLTQPDLLLLDEPTNHLDLFAVEWLESYLRDYSGTIVIVSHDRYFLDEVVTKVVDLEDGEFHVYHGNYSSFLVQKEERLMREFQQYEEQQKKIKKMRETIKRLRIWANEANPPNAGLHRRASSMEKALERMEKLRKPIIDPKKMQLEFESTDRSGKEVLILEDVTKGYEANVLFQQVNMSVYWQDRMAIVGRNGTGKSTILKLALEQEQASEGIVKIGSNVKVGFLSQHFVVEDKKARLIDVFRDEVAVFEGEARQILAKFMFYGPDVFKRVGDLSGGEKMRLRLAQLMHQDVNFLLLDEPTNHLDIESREVLEDALEEFTGTILAVSHDRYFLNKLFPRTAWLENQSIVTFEGSYEYARKKWDEVYRVEQAPVEKIRHDKPEKRKPEPQRNVEEEIADLERKLESITQAMENESDWNVYESQQEEKVKVEQQLESLLAEWLEESV